MPVESEGLDRLGSSNVVELVIPVGIGMGGIHLVLASRQVFLKLGKKCWHPQGWATNAQKVVMRDLKIRGDPTPAPEKKRSVVSFAYELARCYMLLLLFVFF